VSLFLQTRHKLYQIADGEWYVVNQGLWCETQLHTALTCGDVDFLMHQTGLVDVCGERLFHSYRTTTATNVTGQR